MFSLNGSPMMQGPQVASTGQAHKVYTKYGYVPGDSEEAQAAVGLRKAMEMALKAIGYQGYSALEVYTMVKAGRPTVRLTLSGATIERSEFKREHVDLENFAVGMVR